MRPILILLFLIPVFFAQAQDDDDEREIPLPKADSNFKKYLDDGLNKNADGCIQWSVTSLIAGFLELSYEQKLSRAFSVEAGGGIKLYNGIDPVDALNGAYELTRDAGFGYSYMAGLRYYPAKGGITQFSYYGLDFRNRTRVMSDGVLTSNDFLFSTAGKAIRKGNISWALITSAGARIYKYNYDDKKLDPEYLGGFVYHIQFKLGYFIDTPL